MAATKLKTYKEKRATAPWEAGKTAAKIKTKTCKRAEQREKGMMNMVNQRRAWERITRVPIKAGTLQPKPIICITKLRPSNPNRAINASIK